MDNQDFVDFYTKMTILNFKLHKGYKLEKEYEEFYSAVQFLIPVFNNIIKNKNLTLDKVLNGKSFETEMVQTSQKYENIPTIHVQSENDYPFVNEVKPEPVKVQEEEDEDQKKTRRTIREKTAVVYSFLRKIEEFKSEKRTKFFRGLVHDFGRTANQGSVMVEFSGTDLHGQYFLEAYFVEKYGAEVKETGKSPGD